jgi:hypothetical protein
MEGAFLGKNMDSTIGSFAKQHNLTHFEITIDFTQIEQNIIVMDNSHAIEFITLGTENILKLDDLEVLAMATNKQRECMHLL